MSFIGIHKPLSRKVKIAATLLSFILPLALWCTVSYVPFVYHPLVEVTDAGGSMLCVPGDEIERSVFNQENASLKAEGSAAMKGKRANPVYLPAPHEVAKALVTSFRTPPKRDGDVWFHESLLHSIKIVFLGFFISMLLGLPLGILCGSVPFFEKLIEPFIEFFRYFPAPVFGALMVAILGINDAPKVAIIFIGTFFQMLPMTAATTLRAETALVEAAETLGASQKRVLWHVIIPNVAPNLFKDMRILLGWAWTYLIVAEVVGTSSGITWFINQQAKYRVFENVYAAIVILGCIGLFCDAFLAWLGRQVFAWQNGSTSSLGKVKRELCSPSNYVFSFRLTPEEKKLKEANNGKL